MTKEELEKEKTIPVEEIMFSEFASFGEEILFFGKKGKILYKMNICTGKVEYVWDEKVATTHEPSGTICTFKNGFVELNLEGTLLSVYSEKGKLLRKERIECHSGSWGNFVAAECYNDIVYVFPKQKKYILKYDVNKKELNYKKSFFENVLKSVSENNVLIKYATRKGEEIWLLTADGKFISFDLRTEKYVINDAPIEIEDSKYAVWHEEILYLLLKNNKIYTWKRGINKTTCIWEAERYQDDNMYFNCVEVCGDKIIVLPSLGEDIIILDKDGKSEKTYVDFPEDYAIISPTGWGKYINGHSLLGKKVYPLHGNYLLIIDSVTGELSWIKPQLPSLQEKYLYHIEKKMCVSESSKEDFLLFCNMKK